MPPTMSEASRASSKVWQPWFDDTKEDELRRRADFSHTSAVVAAQPHSYGCHTYSPPQAHAKLLPTPHQHYPLPACSASTQSHQNSYQLGANFPLGYSDFAVKSSAATAQRQPYTTENSIDLPSAPAYQNPDTRDVLRASHFVSSHSRYTSSNDSSLSSCSEGPIDMSLNRRHSHTPSSSPRSVQPHPPPSYSSVVPLRPSAFLERPASRPPSHEVVSRATTDQTSGWRAGSCANVSATSDTQSDYSGVCDPAIDEHFRRSLGNKYNSLFSRTPANVSPISSSTPTSQSSADRHNLGDEKLSIGADEVDFQPTVMSAVDDHFAKALGETWFKLRNSTTNSETDYSSNNGCRTTPRH